MPKELRHSGSQRSPPVAGPAHMSPTHGRHVSVWSAEDDERLKAARTQGLNWQPIATKYFPTKSANACRKRHERLMVRKHAEDWEGEKLENLAAAYWEVREEMWSILARKVSEKCAVSEKWTMFEAKCMEKGYKNLKSANRSARRKERGETDSGIGVSDTENGPDPCRNKSRKSIDKANGHDQSPEQQRVTPPSRSGPSIESMLSPVRPNH